jgi:hypothetical protein
MIFWETRSAGRSAERNAMIDRSHALPIAMQAKVLNISRVKLPTFSLRRHARFVQRARRRFPFIARIFADGGCQRRKRR